MNQRTKLSSPRRDRFADQSLRNFIFECPAEPMTSFLNRVQLPFDRLAVLNLDQGGKACHESDLDRSKSSQSGSRAVPRHPASKNPALSGEAEGCYRRRQKRNEPRSLMPFGCLSGGVKTSLISTEIVCTVTPSALAASSIVSPSTSTRRARARPMGDRFALFAALANWQVVN